VNRGAIVLISRHEKLTTLPYSIFWCLELSRKMSESICEYLPTVGRDEAFSQENDSETCDVMPTHFQAHGFTAGMLDRKEQLESLPKRTYHRVFGGTGDVKHVGACM